MEQTMNWFTQNWETLVAGAGAVVMLSRIVVRLTPTPKDDTVLKRIVDFLKALGLKID